MSRPVDGGDLYGSSPVSEIVDIAAAEVFGGEDVEVGVESDLVDIGIAFGDQGGNVGALRELAACLDLSVDGVELENFSRFGCDDDCIFGDGGCDKGFANFEAPPQLIVFASDAKDVLSFLIADDQEIESEGLGLDLGFESEEAVPLDRSITGIDSVERSLGEDGRDFADQGGDCVAVQ